MQFLLRLFRKSGPLVPVLRFTGHIGMVTPLRPGISLAAMATAIQRAFSMKGAQAVAIQVNSPGGSAVQSILIYKRIRALADKSLEISAESVEQVSRFLEEFNRFQRDFEKHEEAELKLILDALDDDIGVGD